MLSFVNTRGLRYKVLALGSLIYDSQPHVLCVSETMLNSTVARETLNIGEYCIHIFNRRLGSHER